MNIATSPIYKSESIYHTNFLFLCHKIYETEDDNIFSENTNTFAGKKKSVKLI